MLFRERERESYKCIVLNSKILRNYSLSKNTSIKKIFFSLFLRIVAKKINKIIFQNNFKLTINNTFFKIKNKDLIWVQHSHIKVYRGNIFENKFLNFFSVILRFLSGLSCPWKKAKYIVNYTKEDKINFKSNNNSQYFYVPLFSQKMVETSCINKNKNFVWIGRFNNNDKNLYFLKEVGKEIYKLRGLEIDIYGYGSDEKILSDALNKGITLKGKIENINVVDVLKNYKTFLLTSNYEGFSFVIVESLACGVYTIARDTFPSLQFLLANNRGKILNKNINPKQFALEALKTLNNEINIDRSSLINFFNNNLTEDKFEKNWKMILEYIFS